MNRCEWCDDLGYVSVRIPGTGECILETCYVCGPLSRDERRGRPVRAESPAIRSEGEAEPVAWGAWEREFVDLGGEGG